MLAKLEIEPKLRSIPWISKHYGPSESLLYQMAKEGTLAGCKRLRNRWYVNEDIFKAYFASGELA